jgi:hypothetical protein
VSKLQKSRLILNPAKILKFWKSSSLTPTIKQYAQGAQYYMTAILETILLNVIEGIEGTHIVQQKDIELALEKDPVAKALNAMS